MVVIGDYDLALRCFGAVAFTRFCHRQGRSNPFLGQIIEGTLEVKLPIIWTDGIAEVRAVREEKESEEKKSEEKESEERRSKCTKRSKSGLAKAAGAEPSGQMRDEQLYAHVARSTCGSQNVKNTSGSEHFWFWKSR